MGVSPARRTSHPLAFLSGGWATFPMPGMVPYTSWCGSVSWVPACKTKGHQFNTQSRHMLGLWAMSPVGGTREATIHWCFSPSPSPSLPLSLKINKIFKDLQNQALASQMISTKDTSYPPRSVFSSPSVTGISNSSWTHGNIKHKLNFLGDYSTRYIQMTKSGKWFVHTKVEK